MYNVLDNYVEIFSDSVEAREIREMCKVVLPQKIDICDGLPHKICCPCITDLKTCRRLMEKFKNADQYLRAIAKYSLYIENKDDTMSDMEDVDGLTDADFIGTIPKNSMVVPLENFKSVVKGSESNYKETNTNNETTSMENGCSGEIEGIKTASTDVNNASLSRLESLISPQIKLSTPGQNLLQGNIELFCSNVVIQTCKDGIMQKALIVNKPSNESSGKNLDEKYVNGKDFGNGNIILLDILKNHDESDMEKDLEKRGKTTFSDHQDSGSTKCTSTNDHGVNTTQESQKYSPAVTVSYKCLECFKVFITYPTLVEHVLNNHQKPNCFKECKNSRLLAEHKKIKHLNTSTKCTKCDPNMEFNNKTELINHVKKVHCLKCTFCDSVFYNHNKLEQHIFAKHDTKVQCTICGKSLKNPQYKKIHETSHNPDCSEICWICGAILKTKPSFLQHMKSHEYKKYTCEICDKVLPTAQSISKHRRTHRPGYHEKNYLCQFCPKRFLQKSTLDEHILTHSTVKPFKCDVCGRGFNRKRNFLQHEKRRNIRGTCPSPLFRTVDLEGQNTSNVRLTSNEIPKLKCDICGRKFFKNTSVRRHRKYHLCGGNPEIIQRLLDEPEVHKCDVCGKRFFSKLTLQYHMRKHTGSVQPFRCEFCGKCYSTRQRMSVHERVHTGEKPFTCSFCSKSFREQKTLHSHEMGHTDNRPHICQMCNKGFKTRRHLVTHTLIHKEASSFRPYPCSQCGRGFVTNRHLQQHIKAKHSTDCGEQEENYPCPECDSVFTNKVSRRRHIKKQHQVQEVSQEAEEIIIEVQHFDLQPQTVVQYLDVIEDDVIIQDQADKNMSDFGLQELTYIISPAEFTT